MKFLWENPLLIKELREEVRSRKIFFLVPAYIAILATVALIAVGNSTGTAFNPLALAGNARLTLFSFIITISILLGLIALVLGASSFTTEREKATYELLELTPLSYTALVLGKFLHAMVIVLLILLSSLPVISTLFFMGGLTYSDVFLSFFYLLLFLSAMTLGAICISILANRTIISIILALGVGVAISILFGIVSADSFRQPAQLGFAVLSPWLVIWQQIFQPTSLKLAGVIFPVWPVYLLLYSLLTLLLLAWARNALDSRKLERNPWTRLLGLVFVNVYVAIGCLCSRSYAPFTARNLEDFYQVLMIVVLVSLPFFCLGSLNDRDRARFERQPLLESLHPGRLCVNYSPTGLLFLAVLLLTVSINITICMSAPWRLSLVYFKNLMIWILPWVLIFAAQRQSGAHARTLFVTYLLTALLCTLVAAFRQSSGAAKTIFDFYLNTTVLSILYGFSTFYFIIARIHYKRKKEPVHAIAAN